MKDAKAIRIRVFVAVGKILLIWTPAMAFGFLITGQMSWMTFGICCGSLFGGLALRAMASIMRKFGL